MEVTTTTLLRRRSMVDVDSTRFAKDDAVVITEESNVEPDVRTSKLKLAMQSYTGSLILNFASFALPALYAVLSKIWIANLDPQFVALTDTYTYMGMIAEALIEGFPKAAWSIITDRSAHHLDERFGIAHTFVLFESGLAAIMLIVICTAAPVFSHGYVPAPIRAHSVLYVRFTSVSTACSVVVSVMSICSRTLDQPDVCLIISVTKCCVNILLDVVFLSPFRPSAVSPTVNTQALIRACCDLCSLVAGLIYWSFIWYRLQRQPTWNSQRCKPSYGALSKLLQKGVWFQAEVCPRMALSLWLFSMSVSVGPEWATATGVFLTMRLTLGFVPLLAIESSCQVLTGHAWGHLRYLSMRGKKPRTLEDVKPLLRYVKVSVCILALIEVAMFLSVGFWFGHRLAFYLCGSEAIAKLAVDFWLAFAWCYGFLALFFQTTSIILICEPKWYLYQSLFTDVVYAFPVNLLFMYKKDHGGSKLFWQALANGGINVFTFINNLIWTGVWLKRYLGRQADANVVSH